MNLQPDQSHRYRIAPSVRTFLLRPVPPAAAVRYVFGVVDGVGGAGRLGTDVGPGTGTEGRPGDPGRVGDPAALAQRRPLAGRPVPGCRRCIAMDIILIGLI